MTGTGTQADPYIVDNWTDFVTAAGTSSAYVEFSENTVIDMDENYSEGISATININCASIDGKNSQITNLYLIDNAALNFTSTCTVENISLLNMRRDGNSGTTFYLSGDVSLSNCIITGSFGGSILFEAPGVRNINCCSITVHLQEGCAFTKGSRYEDTRCLHLNDSILRVSGNPLLTGQYRKFVLDNSMIAGKLPTNAFYKITSSIINCDIPDNTSITASSGKGYINSDLFGTGVTVDSHFASLTDEQLQDAEYLESIGFPIGVE